jgi:hypothetical protein
MAIDAHAARFEALWRVGDLGGSVLDLARSPKSLSFLVRDERDDERWRYELPSLTLRERTRLLAKGGGPRVDAEGRVATFVASEAGAGAALAVLEGRTEIWRHAILGRPVAPLVHGPWGGAIERVQGGARLLIFAAQEERLSLEAQGAEAPVVRLSGGTVIYGDERGRVLAFDLERGPLLDLRLTP